MLLLRWECSKELMAAWYKQVIWPSSAWGAVGHATSLFSHRWRKAALEQLTGEFVWILFSR